jgi:hypothetical protein
VKNIKIDVTAPNNFLNNQATRNIIQRIQKKAKTIVLILTVYAIKTLEINAYWYIIIPVLYIII